MKNYAKVGNRPGKPAFRRPSRLVHAKAQEKRWVKLQTKYKKRESGKRGKKRRKGLAQFFGS